MKEVVSSIPGGKSGKLPSTKVLILHAPLKTITLVDGASTVFFSGVFWDMNGSTIATKKFAYSHQILTSVQIFRVSNCRAFYRQTSALKLATHILHI